MKRNTRQRGRLGFTLVEIMIASAIMFSVIGGIFQVFYNTMLTTKSGTSQAMFNADAMLLQQRITREIEQSKFAVVYTWSRTNDVLYLYEPNPINNTLITTVFWVSEHSHQLYRERWGTGVPFEWSVVQSNVMALSIAEPPFAIDRKAVNVALHIGDRADDERYYGTGPGYQGVEVRFSVVPRNLQLWYD